MDELVVQEQESLRLWRQPEDILREAQQAAVALQKRISGKKKPVIFNGEQYIESDDWEMLGHFFGYSAKVESTEFVDFGGVKGFRAVAVLLNERTGMVVSRAESMCLNDEENWGPRPKYEWKDVIGADGKPIYDQRLRNGQGGYRKEKIQIGEVPTPMFQLLSMAQTRACAKVHRNKLAWVVTLAGYQCTPAEELEKSEPIVEAEAAPLPTEIKRKESPSPAASRDGSSARGEDMPHQPHATPAVQAATPAPRSVPAPPAKFAQPSPRTNGPVTPTNNHKRVISEQQARRFYAIWKSHEKDPQAVKEYLQHEFGITDDRQIPADGYEKACAWAEILR